MLEAVKLQEKSPLEGSLFGAMPNLRKDIALERQAKKNAFLGHPRSSNLTILTALSLQDVSLKRLTPALYEDAGLWHNT